MNKKVLLVSKYDSHYRVGKKLINKFDLYADCEHYLFEPDEEILNNIKRIEDESNIKIISLDNLEKKLMNNNYNAVYLGMPGSLLNNTLKLVYNTSPRMITIGGFPGHVLTDKKTILRRSKLDIFFVNNKFDLKKFTKILKKNKNFKNNLLLSGYFFGEKDECNIEKLKTNFKNIRYKKNLNIVFAGQTNIPYKLEDRKKVLLFLNKLVKQDNINSLIIKPRHKPQEKTGHLCTYHEEKIYVELFKKSSSNKIRFSYDSMDSLINSSDIILSVSSTATIESLLNGTPAVFLKDFVNAKTSAQKKNILKNLSYTGVLFDNKQVFDFNFDIALLENFLNSIPTGKPEDAITKRLLKLW